MLLHETQGTDRSDTGRSVFTLIEELLGKTMKLLDQKLLLLRLEVEDSVALLLRHLAVVLAGGVFAALGLVLSGIALALWIGNHLGSAMTGFAVTGAGLFVLGAALVAIRLQRGVGPRKLLPARTVKELEKDTQWIRSAR